jgi:hypothetical protein
MIVFATEMLAEDILLFKAVFITFSKSITILDNDFTY